MVANLDQYLDEPEHDSRQHSGIPGVGAPTEFGDGSLGDVVLTGLLETSGDLHYNSLEIGPGGDLVQELRRPLTVRVLADCTVRTGRTIRGDGRGWDGGQGGDGGNTVPGENPAPALPPVDLVAAEGGTGGGGGSAGPFGTQQPGGNGAGSTLGVYPTPREWSLVDYSTLVWTPFGGSWSGTTYPTTGVTIPANTLFDDGDYIDFRFSSFIRRVAGAGSIDLELRFNGATGTTLTVAPTFSWANFSAVAPGNELGWTGRIYKAGDQLLLDWEVFIAPNVAVNGVRQRGTEVIPENPGEDLLVEIGLQTVGALTYEETVPARRFHLVPITARNQGSAGGANGGPGGGGGAGNNGTGGTINTTFTAQASANYALLARSYPLFGAGGGGGGGGGSVGAVGPPGTGGGPGNQTGLGTGDGTNGAGSGGSEHGGGGGGGGTGGGNITVWCGGTLTIEAGARISAIGGNGGVGGTTGNSSSAGGAAAGGGGGGYVGVFYGVALVNLGSINANGGLGGGPYTGFGIGSGGGGPGAPGIVVIQKVAA